MNTVLKWLYLVALAVWVGEVVFFSFVVAPAVFGTFAAPEAGRIVGAIFPRYYAVGGVCGAVALATSVLIVTRGGSGAWRLASAMLAIMLAATLYAGVVVLPRATHVRETIFASATTMEGSPLKPEFDRLHRRAVQLNSAVLLCGLVACAATASTLRP